MRRAAFALLLCVSALPAMAQSDGDVRVPGAAATGEIVTRFATDIAIGEDGQLTITETIAVRTRNETIKHGIYRYFPAVFGDASGMRILERLNVTGVQMDGHDEVFDVKRADSDIRVQMGDEKVLLTPGDHVFVLHYTVGGHVDVYKTESVMLRNVTGGNWQFPIAKADITIHVPKGDAIARSAFTTGPAGSEAQDAVAQASGPDTLHLITTAPLNPGEGVIVALAFHGAGR